VTADADLLQRRMQALNDPEMRLRDWDAAFVGDVCWHKPEALTPRQREMVAVICWRYRDQIAPDLVPPAEPKLTPQKRWVDRPLGPTGRPRGLRRA